MERLLDKFLDKVKTRVIKMCSLVDDQFRTAVKSIDEENVELAQLAIKMDKKVDKFDTKIDKICQKIFALTQPVAMDLRLLMSAMTINTNLERIGDISVNIAEEYLTLNKKPEFFDETTLPQMFSYTQQMLKNSIDAYINRDAALAIKVIEADDELDKLNNDNLQLLINIMKRDPKNIEAAISLLVISRHLERVGDHATNIAEDVIFLVEAHLVKHKYEKYIFTDDEDDDNDEEDSNTSVD